MNHGLENHFENGEKMSLGSALSEVFEAHKAKSLINSYSIRTLELSRSYFCKINYKSPYSKNAKIYFTINSESYDVPNYQLTERTSIHEVEQLLNTIFENNETFLKTSRIGQEKGINAENMCQQALLILQNQGKITTFEKTDLWEEGKARDFKIEYKSFIIPLQIKSSTKGQFEHKTNALGVPSLVIKDTDRVESITEKIMKIVTAYEEKGNILHL
jgi:hypothetical protein